MSDAELIPHPAVGRLARAWWSLHPTECEALCVLAHVDRRCSVVRWEELEPEVRTALLGAMGRLKSMVAVIAKIQAGRE